MATKYVSALDGGQMDSALMDMATHTSEAWAVGTRNGQAVSASDVTYHNNAKYYSDKVSTDTQRAEDAAARAEAAVPAGTAGAVFFDRSQSLTDAQKYQVQANIGAGATNPNLLDNPWFTINQRGAASYTGNEYMVDRWRGANSRTTITVNSGYITLSTNSSGNGFLRQILPQTYEGTFTYSVMLRGTGSGNISFQDSGGTGIGTATTYSNVGANWTLISCTLTTSGTPIGGVVVRVNTSTSVDILCAKMEKGGVSTLANDVPPDYGTELRKCEYCAYVIKSLSNFVDIALGVADSATTITFTIFTPNLRNASRTVTISGVSIHDEAGNIKYYNSHEVTGYGSGYTKVKITTSGLTTGKTYMLQCSTNGQILISADL